MASFKCFLCGGQVPMGQGKMVVKISGNIFRFCGSKCEKNWEKGREGKGLKWTAKFSKGSK